MTDRTITRRLREAARKRMLATITRSSYWDLPLDDTVGAAENARMLNLERVLAPDWTVSLAEPLVVNRIMNILGDI